MKWQGSRRRFRNYERQYRMNLLLEQPEYLLEPETISVKELDAIESAALRLSWSF